MKKSNFTKVLILLLTLTLSITVFGCKRTPKKGTETTTAETTTESTAETTHENASGTTENTTSIEEALSLETPSDAPISDKGVAGDIKKENLEELSEYVPTEPKTSQGGEQVKLLKSYQDLVKSGKYLMEVSVVDGEETLSVIYAKSGKKKYGQIDISGLSLAYLETGDKSYALSSKTKKYTLLLSEFKDAMSSMFSDVEGFLSIISNMEDYKYVKTTKVKEDGKTLTCESYSDGTETLNFYFDGTKLVKMESIYDGTSSILNIGKITADVNENIFEIPKGYLPLGNLAFFAQFDDEELIF